MSILIKNITLVPMDGKDEIKENVSVLVEGNKIKDIFQNEKDIKADKVIDGENKLLMPGLVNAHTHIGMSVFRNYADDMPLHQWLTEAIWPIEGKLEAEDLYWASLLSIIEMVESGTTTFADMYFFMDEVARAVGETGIRAVLARGLSDDKDPDKNRAKLNEVRQMYENWNNKFNNRIKVMVGPHAPYTCGTEFLKECVALAKDLNTGIHIHLSETKKEVLDCLNQYDKSPIEYAKDIGIFDVHTLAAHCVILSDEDLDIIRDKNVFPVNNPASNLKLGSGFAKVDDMLRMGIPVSLGTDGSSSNNNLNMFEEIKLAAIVNKALTEDATAVSAYEALEMATINGAMALGLEDEIGSIEPGKKADLIILDLNKSHFHPRNNLISALAYSAQGSDVDTVIIDGEVIMENRKFPNIDIDMVFKESERVIKELENR